MTAVHGRLSSDRLGARAVGLVAVATLVALSGCGSSGSDATSVTGSCAMEAKSYARVSPVSASDLEALLGKGSYRVEGNVRPGAGGVPEAGECSYARLDKPHELLLQVGVNRQTDLFRSYVESRTLQKSPKATPIEGADGYTIPDPGTGPGSGDNGPLAVVFGPDHWTLTMHLVGAKQSSSDATRERRLATAAKSVANYLSRPMRAR